MQQQDYQFLEQLMNHCKDDFDRKAFEVVINRDRQFHEYLVMKSGLLRILNFWRQIMTQWEVLLYRGSQLDLPYDSLKFVTIHDHILFSLQVGDLNKANELLGKHCELSRSEFKRAI